MSRHWVSPSLFLSSSSHIPQHNYTTQTATRTVTLTSTSHHKYTDTRRTCNVVCPSGASFENKPYSRPSIRHAWNPKCVIVQWVGIRTHTQITCRPSELSKDNQRNENLVALYCEAREKIININNP